MQNQRGQLPSLPFLNMQSSIVQTQFYENTKRSKKNKKGGTSILYQQLQKINDQPAQRKRSLILKYLKNEGQMKDTNKSIAQLQQQGPSIPILQVAISISKYNKDLLKQLLDSKTIQEKQQNQTKQFQLSQQITTDPILRLLSDSQILKKISQKKLQNTYVDYKHISPTKKNQIIDEDKGKFRKIKRQNYNNIQFPKQLTKLKKQLFSLPYINRYKDILAFKNKIKNKHLQTQVNTPSSKGSIKKLTDLNHSVRSLGSSTHKNKLSKANDQKSLQQNLQKALQKRTNKYKQLNKSAVLSNDNNQPLIFPNINSKTLSKSFLKTEQTNFIRSKLQQTILKSDDITLTTKNGFSQSKSLLKPPPNLDKSHSTIRDTQQGQSQLNPQQSITKSLHTPKQTYWPCYQKFNLQNTPTFISKLNKIKTQLNLYTQMKQIPSQQTLKIYYSLKKVQDNDIKKLQIQSYKEQKQFSNTKYKVKYKNIKENYNKRVKTFINDKKRREFQLQQCSSEESKNLVFKQIKLNQKMLSKMVKNGNEENS